MPPKATEFGIGRDLSDGAGAAAEAAVEEAAAEAAWSAAAETDWWQQRSWQQATPWQPPQRTYERGLDAGLAKAMPLDFDGKAQNYRDYRRRLELFRKLCRRREARIARAKEP